MCLITYKQEYKKANHDIIVYKALTENRDSPHQHFHYPIDELMTSELKSSGSDMMAADSLVNQWITKQRNYYEALTTLMSVGEGLHAFTNVPRGKEYIIDYLFGGDEGLLLFEAIIPKGSVYLEDETGLIVSNQLVVTNKII